MEDFTNQGMLSVKDTLQHKETIQVGRGLCTNGKKSFRCRINPAA